MIIRLVTAGGISDMISRVFFTASEGMKMAARIRAMMGEASNRLTVMMPVTRLAKISSDSLDKGSIMPTKIRLR